MVFGLPQEEHPEKRGLFAEHRQTPLLLETPELLHARRDDLGAPHAHYHRPAPRSPSPVVRRCLVADLHSAHTPRPRGHRTTFLTIEVLPFYDPPAGHFDKRVDPRNPLSLYREAVGVTSTEGWTGGWKSIRGRGSRTPYRASALC